MRALSTVAAIAIAALLLPMGAANAQGWEDVSEYEARFAVRALTIGLEKVVGKRDRSGDSYQEFGYWGSARDDKILALHYMTAAPGKVWSRSFEIDAKGLKEAWPFLSDLQFSLEEKRHTTNVLGRIQYRRFRTDVSACLGFGQMFDRDPSGRPADSRRLISGVYCDYGLASLSTGTVEKVLKSFGIRDYSEP